MTRSKPLPGFRSLEGPLLRIYPPPVVVPPPTLLAEGASFRSGPRVRTILLLRDDRVTYRLRKLRFCGAEVVKTVSRQAFLRLIGG